MAVQRKSDPGSQVAFSLIIAGQILNNSAGHFNKTTLPAKFSLHGGRGSAYPVRNAGQDMNVQTAGISA